MGIGVTSHANLIDMRLKLEAYNTKRISLEFISAIGPQHLEPIIPLLEKSKSQIHQDLFVLTETQFKKSGYFVEFGATDGILGSNTYLLEIDFEWRGILAEPNKYWHLDLSNNRLNSFIETSCLWKDSKSNLVFYQTKNPSLSTIDFFTNSDRLRGRLSGGTKYNVQTISLIDLLRKYNAPEYIDYLSIDTEGSEFEILSSFNFKEFTFGVITVEHNFTAQRQLIYDLLTSNGYKRKFANISGVDDWYTKL